MQRLIRVPPFYTIAMEDYNALKSSLNSPASIEYSDVQEATVVEVPDYAIGRFYKEVRENDLEDVTTAKRLGDTLVARIESEEPQGLGQLFG